MFKAQRCAKKILAFVFWNFKRIIMFDVLHEKSLLTNNYTRIYITDLQQISTKRYGIIRRGPFFF